MAVKAEYIWIDGAKPTAKLRSKTKVMLDLDEVKSLDDLPLWGFDGSSTQQAEGHASDCALNQSTITLTRFEDGHTFWS